MARSRTTLRQRPRRSYGQQRWFLRHTRHAGRAFRRSYQTRMTRDLPLAGLRWLNGQQIRSYNVLRSQLRAYNIEYPVPHLVSTRVRSAAATRISRFASAVNSRRRQERSIDVANLRSHLPRVTVLSGLPADVQQYIASFLER